ncbi:MAG: ABC transporter permease [Propionibacteriaceae bacterium]|jgi:peptide/nickel transport system permease protein|nr:ABC transporter permease [Propionibacteriaceae bacterium]
MALLRAATRRVVIFLVTVLVASAVIFGIVQALPGDVALATLGMGASPESVDALRVQWGLDRPLALRYLEWVVGMVHGDFGASYLTGQSVVSQIGPPLAVTAWLVGLSMPLSLLAALPLGLVGAMGRRRWFGVSVNAATHVGLAIPVFFVGAILTIIFAVKLRWVRANGYVPLTTSPGEWAIRLVLPVASIVIVQACFLARYVRAGFIDVLTEDYYRTARAVGWTRWRGLWRHGIRNVATSVVTVIGLQLASLLVGAILVEQTFAMPGLGSLLVQAVRRRDLMVVQGVGMLLVAAVLTVNFLVDLAYLAIDPRLKRGGRS